MNNLTRIYQDLTEVYNQLDNLTKIAYFKLYRRENLAESDIAPEHIVKRHNEDEYDLIAYTNAINLKFQFYCSLAFKYLKLYLQSKYSGSCNISKDLIEQAFKNKIITAQDYKKLAQLTRYIKQIAKPDAHGNYEYTDAIIEYYHALNDMLARLNPKAPIQEIYSISAHMPAATLEHKL